MGSNARSFKVPDKNYGFPRDAFDPSILPDVDVDFLRDEDLEAFRQALVAPDTATGHGGQDAATTYRLSSPSSLGPDNESLYSLTLRHSLTEDGALADADDARSIVAQAAGESSTQTSEKAGQSNGSLPTSRSRDTLFITAQNDWAPVHVKVKRAGSTSGVSRKGSRMGKKNGRPPRLAPSGVRTTDETREGYLYGLLKYPFLLIVGAWVVGLATTYVLTRYYIWFYEHYISWRGQREQLRRAMRATSKYRDWRAAARSIDEYFGNAAWKEKNEFAYYDWKTIKKVWDQLKKSRAKATSVANVEKQGRVTRAQAQEGKQSVENMKTLLTACVKNNFVGVENPRLYSQTYYGTKNLVQNYTDEVTRSLDFILETDQIDKEEKRVFFKAIYGNYGRTALCLSGGAAFAYYHFGVVKALLEEDLLPDVITGTSGGALVAGLVATRTNEELKELLVPALAEKITACSEPFAVWFRRWWKTGARFDAVKWAKECSWWTRGSMTFREAYERTGRILNVSCVPADPHSPTILCNYLTSPDCVIWSATLASAAVPGIMNPVVLMMKQRDGTLMPYSFGHKWKDGSLRTDIPIKALNLHFNVNFTIVSQVNPHINLFFFSSRGSVGHPVTHRKGRGWRGGFLGSAAEQYIKLDLTKWLKVLRQLELLPRPLGQDWSQIWLQSGFGGTITIWPQSIPADFPLLLSDPHPARLARMLHEGQQSAFPTLKFISNRLKIERLVEKGRRETRPFVRRGSIETIISEDDLKGLMRSTFGGNVTATEESSSDDTDLDAAYVDAEEAIGKHDADVADSVEEAMSDGN